MRVCGGEGEGVGGVLVASQQFVHSLQGKKKSSAGQCTATDCNVEGLVRVSLGVAGLLWLVAVCGDVGLRDWGEFDRNAGMCGGSAEKPGMEVGVGLIGTGIAGNDCPP